MSDRESDHDDPQLNERLVFVDDHHQAMALARINTLRRGGHFTDVILNVDGRNIPAHRVVLGCTSNFLFELFTEAENQDNDQAQTIKLENVDFESFDILVQYAYTSRLEVPADRVKSVYKTAVMLKMNMAAAACSRHLAMHLTTSNCLDVRAFANSHVDSDLALDTDAFIQEHVGNVTLTTQSSALPFIQADILGVDAGAGSAHLCELAVEWAQQSLETHSLDELVSHLHKLFLAGDNSLHDCDEADEAVLSSSDELQDYKRIQKKRQKVKKRTKPGPPPSPLTEGRTLINSNKARLATQHEYKVIATQSIDERSYMVIAILGDNLVRMSLKMNPTPCDFAPTATPNHQDSNHLTENRLSPVTTPKNSASCEKLCTLTPLAAMSSPRCALGAAVLDGRLVALGGYDRGECLSSVEEFHLATNTWTPMEKMLSPRGRFGVAQHGTRLYAFGGSNGQHELRTAEYYDGVTKAWERLPDMLAVRTSSCVCVVGGTLYVLGGWSGQAGLADCEAYSLADGCWRHITPMHTGRAQAGACEIQGKVAVVGGCNSWTSSNTLEVYSPSTNTWDYRPDMGTARRGAGVAFFQGKLYVVGGSDGTSVLTSTETYDPATQAWTYGPSLNVPRVNVGAVVLKNRLFAVGGFSGKVFLNSIEFLDTDAAEWCSYVPSEV